MPFARDWNLVELTGTYLGSNGEPITGMVTFTVSPERLVDSAALQTIIRRPLELTLGGTGSFTVLLPATDDPDITPEDFTYHVLETFEGGGGGEYDIELSLLYLESGVDIALLAHVPPADGVIPGVTRAEFEELWATVASLEHYDGGWSDSHYAGEVDGGSAELPPSS
jgi:hypothetical protein